MRAFLLAIGLTVVLSACTIEVQPEATATPTPTTATTQSEPAPTGDEAFLSYLDKEAPEMGAVDDSTLLDAGESVCEGLDSDLTLDAIIGAVLEGGLTEVQVARLIYSSVTFLCPEYNSVLEQLDTDSTV